MVYDLDLNILDGAFEVFKEVFGEVAELLEDAFIKTEDMFRELSELGNLIFSTDKPLYPPIQVASAARSASKNYIVYTSGFV